MGSWTVHVAGCLTAIEDVGREERIDVNVGETALAYVLFPSLPAQ